jgi:putative transposase
MHAWGSLSHVRGECKYHVVFIPKYRRKAFYGKLRRAIGGILKDLCRQRGVELPEGHAMRDHVHLCLSIPPKYSVAHTVGFLKGKSAERIHRELLKERRIDGSPFSGYGLLCKHGGARRNEGPEVHPRPRQARSTLGWTTDLV